MIRKDTYTDEEIIAGLGKVDESIIKEIYLQYRLPVLHLVENNHGTQDEGKDIFQNTLLVLMRKVSDPEFELRSSLKTYVYGIAKNLWWNELKKKQGKMITSQMSEQLRDQEDLLMVEEEQEKHLQIQLIKTHISKLSTGCQELLQLFYVEGLTMQEIKEWLNQSSESYVKLKKFRCMEKLKELIHGKKG